MTAQRRQRNGHDERHSTAVYTQPQDSDQDAPEAAEPGSRLSGQRTDSRAEVATRLLVADELAERWQVPKAQVYRLAREGKVPAVRVGRYMRFSMAAIEAWELAGGARADG